MSTLKSINVIHPSSATNNIVNDASGNVAIGNNLTVAGTATVGGVAAVAVAPSTAGNVLTSTGSAWASTAPAGGGLPTPSAIGQIPFSTNGSTYAATQKITQGTAVTLTSQTSVDFTGIPSWVKRITIVFYGASTSGTSQWLVQIGSTTFTTSGYSGAGFAFATTGGISSSASGFLIYNDNAGDAKSGLMTIDLVSGNLYVSSHELGSSSVRNVIFMGGGASSALGGTLDRIRLTTVNGTDQFDTGTVNILYE